MAGGYWVWAPSPFGTELTQLTTHFQPNYHQLYSKKHYNYPVLTVDSSIDNSIEYTPYDKKVYITIDNDKKRERLKALHYNASYAKANDKLSLKFPNIPVMTYWGVKALKKCPFNPYDECIYLIKSQAFLPIRMPYFFNYTTVVMRNNVWQGLLHTLLRHPREWGDQIPEIGNLWKYRDNLNDHIWAVTNKRCNYDLLTFEKEMEEFSPAELLRLSNMQMHIYDYFENYINQETYMGEGCSDDGSMNILFNVSSNRMLVGLSNVVFGANRRVADHRRIRLITTAYFNKEFAPLLTLQKPTLNRALFRQ
uniref:Exostosin domain-containing protein n=1 Tax=Panagrellus redivivus TaxID=6233 RepID=A0A7E4VE47_PANRE